MTKLNISLISLGALSITGASAFGIYKSLDKKTESFPKIITEENIVEEKINEESPIRDNSLEKISIERPEIKEKAETLLIKEPQQNIPAPVIKKEEIIKAAAINKERVVEIRGNLIQKVETKEEKRKISLSPKPENKVLVYSIYDDENKNSSYASRVEGGDDFGFSDMPENYIGRRFAKYFITSKDDPLWDKHVDNWKSTFNNPVYRGNLSDFDVRSDASITKSNLIIKCNNAHKKTNWTDKVYSGKTLQDAQYWAMVWQLCGHWQGPQPNEWYPE